MIVKIINSLTLNYNYYNYALYPAAHGQPVQSPVLWRNEQRALEIAYRPSRVARLYVVSLHFTLDHIDVTAFRCNFMYAAPGTPGARALARAGPLPPSEMGESI